jgi:putative phosphoesterase
MRRIALLSDVHANWHALLAVWDDLQSHSPDEIYCLGDLVGYGVFPNQVVEFVHQHSIPTVMGNYDEGVGFDLDDCGCAYSNPEQDRLGKLSLAWTRRHTTAENKSYLRQLPMQIRTMERKPRLLLVHGSPRRMNECVFEDRPRATFERIAKIGGSDIICFGHTHQAYQKRVNGVLFVNAGSVGRPKDGDPRAGYAVLELGRRARAVFHRAAYDVGAAAAAIRNSDMPDPFAEALESAGGPRS